MKYSVEFYMKNKPMEVKNFDEFEKAREFMIELNDVKDCESHRLRRKKIIC